MIEALDRGLLIQKLAGSGLFDAAWYLRRNDDVAAAGLDPLQHFIHHGWAEGRSPNRYFDSAWYRLDNPDVTETGLDPLLHYMHDGERQRRRPHPMFDPAWYRSVYYVPPAQLALGHYVTNRASGRFVPCPELFAVSLLARYRDDPAAGIDPVAHYLDDIEADRREAFPDLAIVQAAALVDENYYLINGPDVNDANLDPADHYCRYGWLENRRPNIYFDPGWYLRTNPEVARLRVNPLVHYILAGEPADRRPVPYFDPGWYRNEYAVPAGQTALRHYLANRRKQSYSPTPLFDVRSYVARAGSSLGPNRDPFAHYLLAGMAQDIDPSRDFDAARYRRTHLGRPSRGLLKMLRPEEHNPLVHYLRAEYGMPRSAVGS
jgi:hypothetical protein